MGTWKRCIIHFIFRTVLSSMRNGSSVLIVILHSDNVSQLKCWCWQLRNRGNTKNSVWCVRYVLAFKGCYKMKLEALLHLHSHVSWQWLWLAAAYKSHSHRKDLFRRGAIHLSLLLPSLAVGVSVTIASYLMNCAILSVNSRLSQRHLPRENMNCAASALGISRRSPEMNCGRYQLH